jgi:hypothetical protein
MSRSKSNFNAHIRVSANKKGFSSSQEAPLRFTFVSVVEAGGNDHQLPGAAEHLALEDLGDHVFWGQRRLSDHRGTHQPPGGAHGVGPSARIIATADGRQIRAQAKPEHARRGVAGGHRRTIAIGHWGDGSTARGFCGGVLQTAKRRLRFMLFAAAVPS